MTQIADITVKCCDCPNSFVFSAGEQESFASRGLTPPRRCRPCRDNRRNQGTPPNRSPGNFPNRGATPAPGRPAIQQPVRSEPVVQYRNVPVFQDSPPPLQAQEAREKRERKEAIAKGERRRDAYQERRERKGRNRDWNEYESFED